MKCAHPECDCIEPTFPINGEFFCNAACAASAAESEDHCGCGHATCAGTAEHEMAGATLEEQEDDDPTQPLAGVARSAATRPAARRSVPPDARARRKERGSPSPAPAPATLEDRQRREEMGRDSGRGDGSRRPDVTEPPARERRLESRREPNARASRP